MNPFKRHCHFSHIQQAKKRTFKVGMQYVLAASQLADFKDISNEMEA